MLLCQEINEVHYTHHIFHASGMCIAYIKIQYCLRKRRIQRELVQGIHFFKAAIPWRFFFSNDGIS